MANSFLYPLSSRNLPTCIGNKAKNLLNLKQIRRIIIPKTWVIPWNVQEQYQNDKKSIIEDLEIALKNHLNPDKKYAVRSSSNVEDESFHSFAGLFQTFLSVQGYSNLKDRIIDVWTTTESETVRSYLDKFSLPPEEVKMAVIIQEMVEPIFSGVCFSCNPMTGSSEIIIEAVPGEGTALVQDGVTPERWVSHSGSWVVKHDHSTLPIEIANQIIKEVKKIAKRMKKPLDFEWVHDGHQLHWVQMREITTLEELNVYNNRFSKDMMPGIIHPLIWSINPPLINTVWLGILEELVGDLPIEPEDLAKSFFYRVYFNMSAIGKVFTSIGLPSEGLEMMMGIVPHQEGRPVMKPSLNMLRFAPRLMAFVHDKWNFERKVKSALPEIEAELQAFTPHPDPDMPVESLLEEIDKLYAVVQKTVYYNIILPLSVTMYMRMLERQLKQMEIDIIEFDLFGDMPELDAFNPNVSLEKLRREFEKLSPSEKEIIAAEMEAGQPFTKNVNGFRAQLKEFLTQFGHLSDNGNNFTARPWRENMPFVLKMVREFEDVSRKKEARIGYEDISIKGVRKLLVKLFYKRTRRFTLLREKVSKNYFYGYGLFRSYFLRIADWMVAEKWLDTKKDIFYLHWGEIKTAVSEKSGDGLMTLVHQRKAEMEEYKDITLPDVIYGEEPPPLLSEDFDRMQGTPTSQGYYSGPAKVIFGRRDFDKVEHGDVIVIPYSDIGWTPLFSRAGAVIAESGGILSHSSIIAREYQIPAVVSVSNCMLLRDNQLVSVNGFTGEIVLLQEEKV